MMMMISDEWMPWIEVIDIWANDWIIVQMNRWLGSSDQPDRIRSDSHFSTSRSNDWFDHILLLTTYCSIVVDACNKATHFHSPFRGFWNLQVPARASATTVQPYEGAICISVGRRLVRILALIKPSGMPTWLTQGHS